MNKKGLLMKVHSKQFYIKPIVVLLALSMYQTSQARVISEDFTKAETTENWLMPLPGDGLTTNATRRATNYACLTASGVPQTKPNASPTVSGTPPRCNIPNNDTVGNGALRLTPSEQWRVGGIVSDFTFPTNEGVDITFTTYTWGGNGADGMTFFLADGSRPPSLGASGGSLGYSCSNENPIFSGVNGGYLGIGIDEWGNFVNGSNTDRARNMGDNTNTGVGFVKNAIGIRGAGDISYFYIRDQLLQDAYTAQGWGTVPFTIQQNWRNFWTANTTAKTQAIAGVIRETCRSGVLTIDSQYTPPGRPSLVYSTNSTNPKTRLFNYQYFAHHRLPFRIDTPSVTSRDQAKPIQYRIKITPDGKASVWYSYNGGTYQPVMLDYDVVMRNGPLPSSFRFGFMGATGGYHNNHEVTCFKAAPETSSAGDASINLPDSQVVSDTQIFLSLYNPVHWTGQVLAYPLVHNVATDTYSVGTPNWDSSCRLNGGACQATGGNNVTARNYTDRVMWTWNGTDGVSLNWSNLNAAQKSSLQLTGETTTIAQQRLEYLKGDRSQEQNQVGVGLFRSRQKGILGDFINSSPTWVGMPSNNYHGSWYDNRHPSLNANAAENAANAQSYHDFIANNATRGEVVYAGSNDGFLHGFRSGSRNINGTFNNTNNDGEEVLAYMPGAVLSRMTQSDSSKNYSHAQYAHNFYNDAAPATGDVFYQGKWHTWLMSGLGAGGNTVYALDITNPNNFTNAKAGDQVIGEWSYDANDSIWKNLGNTYGTPVFGRFHDGNWGAVFGNGWCSTTDASNGNCTANSGPAGIYIMSIDKNTGNPSFKFISTNVGGTAASPNGIAYVTPMDVDHDRIYDYAYAGDLKGNVWRFDLTASNSTTWTTKQPQKIFTTKNNQPISTKIIVSQNSTRTGGYDPILNFGTGLRSEGYLGQATSYSNSPQSIYGLRDRTARTFPAITNDTAEIKVNDLLEQRFNADNSLTNNAIDWNTHKGWYLDLGSTTLSDGSVKYEQVIYNPLLEKDDYLIVNTYIDGSTPTLSCTSTAATGYTYPLQTASGEGIRGFIDNDPDGTTYRLQLNASGTAKIIRAPNGKIFLLTKDHQGNITLTEIFLPTKASIRRLAWREIF